MPTNEEMARAVAEWYGPLCDCGCGKYGEPASPDLLITASNLQDDLNDARLVEDEIERRGLEREYAWKLIGVVFGGEVVLGGALEWFRISHATAAQKLAAAYGLCKKDQAELARWRSE